MTDRPMIIDDLALFALQGGPMSSSKMAKMFGITNIEAKTMLRNQIKAGYVVEKNENGSRLFELIETDAADIVLED